MVHGKRRDGFGSLVKGKGTVNVIVDASGPGQVASYPFTMDSHGNEEKGKGQLHCAPPIHHLFIEYVTPSTTRAVFIRSGSDVVYPRSLEKTET